MPEMITMVSSLKMNLNQNRKERVSRCETRLREERTLNFLKWTGARMSGVGRKPQMRHGVFPGRHGVD